MNTKAEPRVTLVIPAFNEADSLPELLAETAEALAEYDWDAIVIDDGSSDGTWKAITGLAERYPVTGLRFGANCGKAAALSAGFLEAQGDYIATLDADLQDDPAEIPAMIRLMRSEGYVSSADGRKCAGILRAKGCPPGFQPCGWHHHRNTSPRFQLRPEGLYQGSGEITGPLWRNAPIHACAGPQKGFHRGRETGKSQTEETR